MFLDQKPKLLLDCQLVQLVSNLEILLDTSAELIEDNRPEKDLLDEVTDKND